MGMVVPSDFWLAGWNIRGLTFTSRGRGTTRFGFRSLDAEILADSPAGYWRLNETSGTSLADASGNGNTGTLSSALPPGAATGLPPADPDGSIIFDHAATLGPIRAVTTLAASGTNYNKTVEFWIEPIDMTTPSSGLIMVVGCTAAFGGGWAVFIDTATNQWHWLSQNIVDLGFNTSALAAAGLRQHVVFVMDGSGSIDLYIDGVYQQTRSSPAGFTTSADVVRFNAQGGDNAHPGRIKLEKAAVYNSALSAARILAHYNAGTLGAISRLRPLAFTSTGTSTSSFSLNRLRKLAFTSAGTSTSVFALNQLRKLTFTSAGTSTSVFALNRLRKLTLTSAGTSTSTFALNRLRPLAFTSAGTSASTFALNRRRGLVFDESEPQAAPLLDSFNAGAAQGLTTRSGWHPLHIWTGDGDFVTDSVPTKATNSATNADNAWGTLFAPDQEIILTLADVWDFDMYVRLIRVAQPASYPDQGYALNLSAGNTWKVYDVLFTGVIASATKAFAVGDQIRFRVKGSTLTAAHREAGGSLWNPIISTTDSRYSGSGYIGFDGVVAGTVSFDSISGGELVPSGGVGTSTFNINRRRPLAFTSTGTSTSVFALNRLRKLAFTSTGTSSSVFALNRKRNLSWDERDPLPSGVVDAFNTIAGQSLDVRGAPWANPSHFGGENGYKINATPNGATKVVPGTWSSMAWAAPYVSTGDVWFKTLATPAGEVWMYVGPYYCKVTADGTDCEIGGSGAAGGPVSIPGGAILAGDSLRLSVVADIRISIKRAGGTWVTILSAPLTGSVGWADGPYLEFSSSWDADIDEVGGGPLASSVGTSTFNLNRLRPLAFTSTGVGTSTFALNRLRKLTFASAGTSTSTFALSVLPGGPGITNLAFISAGVGTSTFALNTLRGLAFTSTGTSTSSFVLSRVRPLSFTSSGTSTSTFALRRLRGLSFASSGVGTSTFTLSRRRPLSFVSAGLGTSSFVLTRLRGLAFTSTGVGTTTFALTRRLQLRFTSIGTSTSTFALNVQHPIPGVFSTTVDHYALLRCTLTVIVELRMSIVAAPSFDADTSVDDALDPTILPYGNLSAGVS